MISVYYYFLRQWNKILDWFYLKFRNTYKVQPYGYCPVQAEGNLPTGEFYYFRSRWSSWSVRIAKTESALWDDSAWVYTEPSYEEYTAGYIHKHEVVKHFNKAVELYYDSEHSRSRTHKD
jgi:hypothetical protein